LIGAPRSGTTLLATMIGRHTDVGIVNEDITGRGVSSVLGKQVTGNKLCVPNQIRLNGRPFPGQRLLKNLGLISEAPKSQYCIRDYLALANLKVIAIVRDGDDAVASMMRRGHTGARKAARRWAEAIETIFELKQRERDRTLVVSFDDLILDPVNTLQSVCEFLDLVFQEGMLDAPRHNPYYPGAELKTEKTRAARAEPVAVVQNLAPGAYAKYRSLLGHAGNKPRASDDAEDIRKTLP
jgi:hypothetical protein